MTKERAQVTAEQRARLGMRHYLRLTSLHRSSGQAACGKRATDKTRARPGWVITCEACREKTGRDVMPRFDRQGRELVAPPLAVTLITRALAGGDEVTTQHDGETVRLTSAGEVKGKVLAPLPGDRLIEVTEFVINATAFKLDRVASAVAAHDEVQPLADADEVTGYEASPCEYCARGVPFSPSGAFHQLGDGDDPFSLADCAAGGRQSAAPAPAEADVPADPKNSPEGNVAQSTGSSGEAADRPTRRERREATAVPIQDIKTASPDFVVRNQTVYLFNESCVNNWSNILRRIADWLDANPAIEESVTDLGGFIRYDMKADDIVDDGGTHVEHVVEVLVSPSGQEAKLPRADQRPRVVSVDLPFDSAHDLVAFGDCDCKLDGGVLNAPCIVCVTRARLFQLTGDAMYADARDEPTDADLDAMQERNDEDRGDEVK